MTFAEFFRALWDYDPFPWQEAVAEKALRGEWPRIGMPTAAGKTALIDIAVFALAMRAPNAARRIFFVVDRRVIVDEAAERAEKIAKKLRDSEPGSELGRVAQSLMELGGTEPLRTATLRGGIPREDGWVDSPLQPLVACSTVDQIGSSLLFRAYGASEYSRPIRAGLAANDALILLDEAHTSRTFARTLELVGRYREWAESRLPLPFVVVEMSATPGADAIRESEKDLEHAVLKRRWTASKPARLVTVEVKDEDLTGLVEGLAREGRVLRDEHGAKAIGVIANRVRTARRVHDLLAKDEGCEAILLIGRSRPFDRDRIWTEWKDRIALGRETDPETPVFVVATQCVEVGANLDFDGLVTEVASIDALEQRFGRLDRDGKRSPTSAAIVAQKDQTAKKFEDKLYGGAMAATWDWLQNHSVKQKKGKVRELVVEMGVRALRQALAETADREALLMSGRTAPVLMPAHVDLLSQTSPEPEISPEVSVYLHGPETEPADVQVVWRADLDGDPKEWADTVAICPPAAAEVLAVPLYAVRKWLQSGDETEVGDIEGATAEAERTKGEMRRVLSWRGIDESVILDGAEQVRAGMTIVAPSWYGGCDGWGWNPGSKEKVADVGDAVKAIAGRPMLRLHPVLAAQWKYEGLAGELREMEHPKLEEAAGEGWVAKVVERLRTSRVKWIPDARQDGQWCAVVTQAAFDQNDIRGSYSTTEIALTEHMKNCAALAGELSGGLPEVLRRTVQRAADAHDLGKADPRFQAWLRGGNPVKAHELIAKSSCTSQNRAAIARARNLAGYPKGGRHELLSVAMLLSGGAQADVDWELLLHLVASHHGRCRPFAPVIVDDEPVTVEHGGAAVSSAHGLERVGSGVSERFWKLTRRYGWYGLAYLEAMVRLADQRQSEKERSDAGKAAHV
jgi:CRISPR-associated endonuclease/helicase Cas3